jgi:hypothetical protein
MKRVDWKCLDNGGRLGLVVAKQNGSSGFSAKTMNLFRRWIWLGIARLFPKVLPLATVAFVMIGFPGVGLGQSLPASFAPWFVGLGNLVASGSGFGSFLGGAVTISPGPPAPSVSASSVSYPVLETSSTGEVIYGFYLEPLGGGTASEIPILLSASGTSSAESDAVGSAYASASAAWGGLSADGESLTGQQALGGATSEAGPSNPLPPSTSFNTTLSSFAQPGLSYGILINALADSDAGVSTSSASAMATASVMIDPSFPQADDYALVFAPDVVVETPEPSILELVVVALAGAVAWKGRGELRSMGPARLKPGRFEAQSLSFFR